jgi:hypothetical protein
LRKVAGARIVALCDVDQTVLGHELQPFKDRGESVAAYRDIRKLLENPSIDAVLVATPNHWHALATIWACQAGKDVYVEKPFSYCQPRSDPGSASMPSSSSWASLPRMPTHSRTAPAGGRLLFRTWSLEQPLSGQGGMQSGVISGDFVSHVIRFHSLVRWGWGWSGTG